MALTFSYLSNASKLVCSRSLARTFAYKSVYHPDNLYGPNSIGTFAYKHPEVMCKEV